MTAMLFMLMVFFAPIALSMGMSISSRAPQGAQLHVMYIRVQICHLLRVLIRSTNARWPTYAYNLQKAQLHSDDNGCNVQAKWQEH